MLEVMSASKKGVPLNYSPLIKGVRGLLGSCPFSGAFLYAHVGAGLPRPYKKQKIKRRKL